MVHGAGLACLGAGLLLSARALKDHIFNDDLVIRAGKKNVRFRQQLLNLHDVQYYGDLSIGGQPIKGLLDTGSFELFVFTANCDMCGLAGKYNDRTSKSLTRGTRANKVHSYGSGRCRADDGLDKVSIGPFNISQQALWLATSCDMPVLQRASFHAIVGLGPPGEPLFAAQSKLKELTDAKGNFSAKKLPDAQEKEAQSELKVEKARRDLLDSFGVRTFSHCLGRSSGSPGWLIWNDKPRKHKVGVLTVPVIGETTWSAPVQNWSLGQDVFGCEGQCVGLVDSGTSLFAVPSKMYDALLDKINSLDLDCSDLSRFPDLHVTLGTHELRFPPSSYIGSYYGEMDKDVQQFIRSDGGINGAPECELLIMDTGPAEMTKYGTVVVLGMPFFREYYTTFSLGQKPELQRELFISVADSGCKPMSNAVVSQHGLRSAEAFIPRRVDASRLRVPRRNPARL